VLEIMHNQYVVQLLNSLLFQMSKQTIFSQIQYYTYLNE